MKLEKGTFSVVPSKLLEMCEDAPQQLALIWLWKYRNSENGDCFPSITTLCKHCKMARTTVCRALDGLEALGLISKEKRFHEDGGATSNLYSVYTEPVRVWTPSSDKVQGASSGEVLEVVANRDTNYTNITKITCEQPKAADSRIGYKECKRCIDAFYAHVKGYPAIGRAVRALAAPIRDFGEQEVYDRLLAYLKVTEARFASLERFKAVIGQYETRKAAVEFFNPHEKLPGE